MGTDDLSKCRKLTGEEAEIHFAVLIGRPLGRLQKKRARKRVLDFSEERAVEREFVREILKAIEDGNMALVIGPPTRPHSTW